MPGFPSIQKGYARNKGESLYSGLWGARGEGLRGFWAPIMGPQGITALKDFSPYQSDGTLEGSMTASDWVMGPSGWALDFDGTNDAVNLGNLGLSSRDGTLFARINFTSVPLGDNNQIAAISVTDEGNANAIQIYVGVHRFTASNHRAILVIRVSATTNWVHYGNTVLSPGVDYDLALVHIDGQAPQLYVNGLRQTLTVLSGTPDLSTTAWWDNFTSDGNYIGVKKVNNNQNWFQGKIYYAGIMTLALSPQEVMDIASGASPLSLRQDVIGKSILSGVNSNFFYFFN